MAALVDRLRLQVGRLDIAPAELEGRNQRSALFKTMFLAFRDGGARDWRSNLAIALGHRGAQHRLQFHHIFPKAVLKTSHGSREADDIANLAFISGTTNRQISDKSPSQYFPQLIEKAGRAAFQAQCIPTDSELLDTGACRTFLVERRKRVSQRLNSFPGHQAGVTGKLERCAFNAGLDTTPYTDFTEKLGVPICDSVKQRRLVSGDCHAPHTRPVVPASCDARPQPARLPCGPQALITEGRSRMLTTTTMIYPER